MRTTPLRRPSQRRSGWDQKQEINARNTLNIKRARVRQVTRKLTANRQAAMEEPQGKANSREDAIAATSRVIKKIPAGASQATSTSEPTNMEAKL